MILVAAVGLGLASMLSLRVPIAGLQGREFSAEQLVANVVSFGDEGSPGNLDGTVKGRQELWSLILDKQVADNRLADGSGFGQNLAADVGVYDEGKETLRNPHNSHLHIMARMGLVGLSLWIALWVGWFSRMIPGLSALGPKRTASEASSGCAVHDVDHGHLGVLLLRSPAGRTAGGSSSVDRLRDWSGGDHRPTLVRWWSRLQCGTTGTSCRDRPIPDVCGILGSELSYDDTHRRQPPTPSNQAPQNRPLAREQIKKPAVALRWTDSGMGCISLAKASVGRSPVPLFASPQITRRPHEPYLQASAVTVILSAHSCLDIDHGS